MTFDDARRVALSFPGVLESTSYGTPSFQLGKAFLARFRPEIDALVVKIDVMDKELLIGRDPKVYFSLPHYDGYAAVLVHLTAVGEGELRRLLEAFVRFASPLPKRSRVQRHAI